MANTTDYSRLLDGNALKAIKAWVEGKGYKTVNYYPSRSYTSGLQISTAQGGSNVTALYVPYMTASQYGVAKVYAVRSSAITATTGGTTSNRYYGVEKDSNGKLFVNVPWTDGGSSAYYQYQYQDKFYLYHDAYFGTLTPYGVYAATVEAGSLGKMFIGYNANVEYPDNNTFRSPSSNNIHITGRNISLNVCGDYAYSDYQGSIVYEHNYYYNNIHVLNRWSTNKSNPESIETSEYGSFNIFSSDFHYYKKYGSVPSGVGEASCIIGTTFHNIRLYSGTTFNVRFNVRTSYPWSTGTAVSTIATLCALLYHSGHNSLARALIASGIYGSYTKPVIAIYATSSSSGLYLVYMNGTTETTVNITSGTVADTLLYYLVA